MEVFYRLLSFVVSSAYLPFLIHHVVIESDPCAEQVSIGVVWDFCSSTRYIFIEVPYTQICKINFFRSRFQLIHQCIIVLFAVGKLKIVIIRQCFQQVIIVGTVVGDVQLAITVYEGKVTIAIESTDMLTAEAYKVLTEHVYHCGCSISIYRHRIGVDLVTTRRHVTTGKYGILDGESFIVQCLPCNSIIESQCVQVFRSDIFALLIGGIIDCNPTLGCYHTACGDVYAAIFCTYCGLIYIFRICIICFMVIVPFNLTTSSI